MNANDTPAANTAAISPQTIALVPDVAVSSATTMSSALANTNGAVTSVTTFATQSIHSGRYSRGRSAVASVLVMTTSW
jgi:hypothetical protein